MLFVNTLHDLVDLELFLHGLLLGFVFGVVSIRALNLHNFICFLSLDFLRSLLLLQLFTSSRSFIKSYLLGIPDFVLSLLLFKDDFLFFRNDSNVSFSLQRRVI